MLTQPQPTSKRLAHAMSIHDTKSFDASRSYDAFFQDVKVPFALLCIGTR